MTPKSLFLFSILLVIASLLGNSTLYDDTIVFKPNSVKTWDTGFLFRESVIVLAAHNRTPNIRESWNSLMMYIMDDTQYQSYIESNNFDSFIPQGNNLEGIESTTDTRVRFRVPYEDSWHIVIINTRPASQEYLEKIFMINLGVEYKAGILRYPGILGVIIAVILHYRNIKRASPLKRELNHREEMKTLIAGVFRGFQCHVNFLTYCVRAFFV